MPSRNKRNKNRSNTNTTSGANPPKNGAVAVKTTNSSASGVIVSKEAEPSQNIKSSITDAKEKLAELQQNVDSIKASIGQDSAETATINANENANAEAPSLKSDEQKSEQQTMKKKRNRNRNRKKNLLNASESVVSSSSDTHESSPTNLAPIATLPTLNDITAKISEEPHQSESNVSSEKIEVDCIKTESVETITEQNVDEQQAISCDASREEIGMMPNKIITDQCIFNDDNVKKTKTNEAEIETEAHKTTFDELREKINVEDMSNIDPKSMKDEKLQKTHNETDNLTDEPDMTIPTDKKSEDGSKSEKIEEELKVEIGKSGMEHDLSEVKRSPKTKNKNNNNNKNSKESKKATNEDRKIEKKLTEQTKAAERAKQIAIEQTTLNASKSNHIVEESVIKSAELTIMSENITKTPTSTPIITTPAPELSKKPIQHEDETAKIWKILEEASKSLEPVEIRMDDEPMINANDPPPIEMNAPILCSSKDEQQIEEKAKDLVALLQTIKADTVKASAQSKPTNEIIQSGAKPKQTNPTKLFDSEPTKTDTKSIRKNPKPIKSNQQAQVHTIKEESPVEKSMEEVKHAQARGNSPKKLVQKSLPIEETSNTILPVDADVIPLDVSIMPDHIDVPEMNTDSKNVQGSDFVPSVEQTAAETKSLVLANSDDIESNILTSVYSCKENASNSMIAQTQDNNSPTCASKKSPRMDDTKNKTKVLDQSMTQEKKRSHLTEKLSQTNCDPKNSHEKVSANSRKSNGKPIIPPKPDNLVSSQARRSQTVSAKSTKVEKILVLTGANADDEDSEDDYIEYKFMPRLVFIATICQSCKKLTKLNERILCQLCNMVSYCSVEHMAKDESQHKDLCSAFVEIAKKRGTFCFEMKNKLRHFATYK